MGFTCGRRGIIFVPPSSQRRHSPQMLRTHTHIRPRDGGGQGGGHGGGGYQGEGGEGGGGPATGYFKQSFLEDPWLPLLRPEEVAAQQRGGQHGQGQEAPGGAAAAAGAQGNGNGDGGEAPPVVEAAASSEVVKDDAEIDIDDL